MVWQVLHYLIGLKELGFDVWYVEDSDQKMLNVSVNDWASTAEDNSAFARRYLTSIGLGDRWVVRSPGSRECFGARDWNGLLRLYADADLVINLCGSHELRPYHDSIRRLLYLETDPGENQVAVASGASWKISELSRYSTLATYATNLGSGDCLIPTSDATWVTTVPPVSLKHWAASDSDKTARYTTIMNWSSPERAVVWQGQTWAWSKRAALTRLIDLPELSSARLALAIRQAGPEVSAELRRAGWLLIDAMDLDRPGAYRRFIRSSRGEVSVAKDQYVTPVSGWVSDRTVCYLAAGRPAVVQRTGISGVPIGEGLLDFETSEEAKSAIDEAQSNYARHSAAALELADQYFAADRVLTSLLERAGVW
jgi:hypothetical protein